MRVQPKRGSILAPLAAARASGQGVGQPAARAVLQNGVLFGLTAASKHAVSIQAAYACSKNLLTGESRSTGAQAAAAVAQLGDMRCRRHRLAACYQNKRAWLASVRICLCCHHDAAAVTATPMPRLLHLQAFI